ncbi:MAG: hypothetical protein L0H83_03455 [Salinisphaera sp.]|nr:hypothetical protein [Salinisphaera sp.]
MANPVELVILELFRNSTFRQDWLVVDKDGLAFNLTNYTPRFLAFETVNGTLLFDSSTDTGETINIVGVNRISLELLEVTFDMWPDECHHQLFVDDSDGKPFAVSHGPVIIYPFP